MQTCVLRISRHCTEEGAFTFQGDPCCYFCKQLADEQARRAEERVLESEQVRR